MKSLNQKIILVDTIFKIILIALLYVYFNTGFATCYVPNALITVCFIMYLSLSPEVITHVKHPSFLGACQVNFNGGYACNYLIKQS